MALGLPNYRVIENIGTGAQTTIYRARCMRTGKDYAIKVIKVKTPEDMKLVDLMRDEHATASSIDYPVIRKTYEFRLRRRLRRVYGALLFMEYIPGIAMADKTFSRPLDQLLELFIQAATGLLAMHRAGYVHADLKPGNILVTPDDHVKLIDLGQSSKLGEAKTRVQGTIDYMAPEQVQRGKLDQRTDVFGLAATLHRILTGKPVPTEMNQTVNPLSQRLLGKRIEAAPQTHLDEQPTCVARFIESCCNSSPDKRLADMQAVIDKLELARTILQRTGTSPAEPDLQDEEMLEEETVSLCDDRLYDDRLSRFLNGPSNHNC